MDPSYVYAARVLRVIDGDTYELDVDLGFRVHTRIEGRLRGIDIAERNTETGQDAIAFVIGTLEGRGVTIQSHKGKRSFARWVVDVWVEGKPLAEILKGFEKTPT